MSSCEAAASAAPASSSTDMRSASPGSGAPEDWACKHCSWMNCAGISRCDDCDAPAPPPPARQDRPALSQLSQNLVLDAQPPTPKAAVSSDESPMETETLTPPLAMPSSAGMPCGDSPESAPEPAAALVSPATPTQSPPEAMVDEPPPPPPAGDAPAPVPMETAPPRPAPAPPDSCYSRADFAWCAALREHNERLFGSAPLRPVQEQAINAAMSGKDVLVVLPTGAGKSRCYQMPALLKDGLTLLVVPLLSLMQDQWRALNAAGIAAVHMNSTHTREESSEILRSLNARPLATKVLLVTPERLTQSVALQNALVRLHRDRLLSRFVVDEAHCVIAWGRDFRPDYLRLGELHERHAGVPWMLLTATLPPQMKPQLFAALKLDAASVVTIETDLNRPHLTYEVWGKAGGAVHDDDVARVAALLTAMEEEGPGGGIVYCHSQAETEKVADALLDAGASAPPFQVLLPLPAGAYAPLLPRAAGVSAAFYHAQVEPEAKNELVLRWQRDELRVIVATNAFGMGVHKADVRLVVHWTMPDSVMALSQVLLPPSLSQLTVSSLSSPLCSSLSLLLSSPLR